jgi:hypothetical protein
MEERNEKSIALGSTAGACTKYIVYTLSNKIVEVTAGD